jgi:hypothetical protein
MIPPGPDARCVRPVRDCAPHKHFKGKDDTAKAYSFTVAIRGNPESRERTNFKCYVTDLDALTAFLVATSRPIASAWRDMCAGVPKRPTELHSIVGEKFLRLLSPSR